MNGLMMGVVLLASQLHGVWSEKGAENELNLVLAKNGIGYLESMMVKTCFTWKRNGEEEVQLFRRDGDEFHEIATYRYDSAKDVFDLASGLTCPPKGMTGILKRKSTEVNEEEEELVEYRKSLAKPDRLASFTRADRLKKLIAEKNPRLKQFTSLLEAIRTDRLVKENVLAYSADADYPFVEPAVGVLRPGYCMYYFYTGCYMADPSARHVVDPREGCPCREADPNDPPCQVGVKPETIKAFCEGMEKLGEHVTKASFEHGKGKRYWREDALGVFVTGEKLEPFYKLLRETILSDETTTRWIMDLPL